ncbi:hypothetical protein [Streptomyces canus]|uniref:hypothetical protein n=1 Tax=Streptomyces canus TaxID=58343 RepID=UPI0036E24BE4
MRRADALPATGSQRGATDFPGARSPRSARSPSYGQIEVGGRGWDYPQYVLPLIGGLALLVVFAQPQRRGDVSLPTTVCVAW